MHAISKYLETYAEPEIRIAKEISERYDRALVVPAYREDPAFLDGFANAVRTSRGRTLVIVVANAPEDAPAMAERENAHMLEGLVGGLEAVRLVSNAPRARLGSGRGGHFDALVVDRASKGARLPVKRGVGLARKIGTDLALALHVGEGVRSPFVFGTDADAVLPDGHFDLPEPALEPGVSAVVFPFWHEATDDPEVTRATALYELSLRYYVAGLAWAGSPYAFHTLGSATAISFSAYAAVRGYPRREAAEDFYLLNKIAKVGPVVRHAGPEIRIRSRTSDRTPFGTGRRVAEALSGGDRGFYAPEVFTGLRSLLGVLDAFAEHADVERLSEDIAELPAPSNTVVPALFGELDARPAFEAASRETKTTEARRRRVHTWFDAFRTLKFVHAVRDTGFANVPWCDARRRASFCAGLPEEDGDLTETRRALLRAERELPSRLGPTSKAARD